MLPTSAPPRQSPPLSPHDRPLAAPQGIPAPQAVDGAAGFSVRLARPSPQELADTLLIARDCLAERHSPLPVASCRALAGGIDDLATALRRMPSPDRALDSVDRLERMAADMCQDITEARNGLRAAADSKRFRAKELHRLAGLLDSVLAVMGQGGGL